MLLVVNSEGSIDEIDEDKEDKHDHHVKNDKIGIVANIRVDHPTLDAESLKCK